MIPEYPIPFRLINKLALAAIFNKPRSFRQDALDCVTLLQPPVKILGKEHIPEGKGFVVTFNHYSRPGFGAWWIALGISASITSEVHWVMTSGWTYPDWLRAHTFTPTTNWAFQKVAQVYHFTNMPSMPPRPEDVFRRSQAVRNVLRYAQRMEQPVIGLAPEGGDSPGGTITIPPPGTGRFIQHLCEAGLGILPVGVFEEDCLCLNFGAPYSIEIPTNKNANARDDIIRRMVMRRIAALAPARLRGEFTD
jgi:hypothetical protein